MTTADYLTIAVSPALIMTLIGSFVFFLIEVFYHGSYQARINYVFALFVFAAVLIGRIWIAEGGERAAVFAVPLALATFLVVNRFVEHAAAASPLINLGIIALVWWWAHKLTWDCTLIDDQQDASGEGLLLAAGLARPARDGRDATTDQSVVQPQVDARPSAGTAPAADAGDRREEEDRMPWRVRYQRRRSRGHTPGMWVLYFALVVLPLFGLLQRTIPLGATARRVYTFQLLVVCVASALGLLLATSFLGLRRYLRQRRLEMPPTMAGAWIATGATLILAVMVFTAALPRPAAEVPLARLPWQFGATDGLAKNARLSARDGAVRDPARSQPEPQESSADQRGPRPDDDRQTGNPPSSPERPHGPHGPDAAGSEKAPRGTQAEAQRRPFQDAPAGGAARSPAPPAAGRPRPRLPLQLAPGTSVLAAVVKLLFYALLLVVAALLLWRYRTKIGPALARLRHELCDLWGSLWGHRTTTTKIEQTAPPTKPEHRFANFADPFRSGAAARMTPETLVAYTFAAFQAWASGHGHPRRDDQTPRELVQQAVPVASRLADPALLLAELHSQITYGPGHVTAERAFQLRSLWALMRAAPPPSTPPAATDGSHSTTL